MSQHQIIEIDESESETSDGLDAVKQIGNGEDHPLLSRKVEDVEKNDIVQILFNPGEFLNSAHSIGESVGHQMPETNDIEKNIKLIKDALTSGDHKKVNNLFDNIDKKKQKFSNDVVRSFIDSIVEQYTKKTQETTEQPNKETKTKKCKSKNKVDFSKCMDIILKYIKDVFLQPEDILEQICQDVYYEICSKGLTELAKCLIDNDVDPCVEFKLHEKEKEKEKSPLHVASKYGYHDLVELLLEEMKTNEEKIKRGLQMTNKHEKLPIHLVVQSAYNNGKDKKKDQKKAGPEKDFFKCLEIVLKYKEYYNIDAQDSYGETALHFATQMRNDVRFTKILIMNGAYTLIKNNRRIIARSRIPPSLIEEILDSCIKYEGDGSVVGDHDFRLTMDLSIFSHKHDLEMKSESEFVRALLNPFYRHLLQHPVISAFLYIKWQKMKVFWYINLFFYMVFFSCLIAYIRNIVDEPNYTISMISLKVLITVLGVYMLIREIIQFCIFRMYYFKSFDNMLEIFILIMTGCLLYHPDPSTRNEFALWIVLGSIIEFIFLIGKNPSYPGYIYIVMFKKVAFNFFSIIVALFLWIILAFSFVFYIMHKGGSHPENQNKSFPENQNETISDIDILVTFSKTLMKTIVMAAGEFEFGDISFDDLSYPLSSRILFIIFIFVVFYVTMNLINGIAISDIQIIRNEAKNHAVLSMAEFVLGLSKTLRILTMITKTRCSLFKRHWRYGLIFHNCFVKRSISFAPNRYYRFVWATCYGHSCSLSTYVDINHCPYYFWMNIFDLFNLFRQFRFIKICEKCKVYYDIRTKNLHDCDRDNECGICRRYVYSNKKKGERKHTCKHYDKYYLKSNNIEEAKCIVEKRNQEAEKSEKQKIEKLQETVNELTDIMRKYTVCKRKSS